MNLKTQYGHTLTLKELCRILKISRSSYYTSTDVNNPAYKVNFPKRLDGFAKVLFLTENVENYLLDITK
ncbi:MAG: hypothetical protein ACPGTQ_08110 [Colwellia sp.]|jgi:predicted DNA-binding transcriptional regulator AlpA